MFHQLLGVVLVTGEGVPGVHHIVVDPQVEPRVPADLTIQEPVEDHGQVPVKSFEVVIEALARPLSPYLAVGEHPVEELPEHHRAPASS